MRQDVDKLDLKKPDPKMRMPETQAVKTQGRVATVGRRDFLRVLGVGAGAAVSAGTPLVDTAQADTESNADKRKARYKETDHVKAYYRVNRYPSK